MKAKHSEIDFNFIFVKPSNIEELSKRIIRDRVGSETTESHAIKMRQIEHELMVAKNNDLFVKIFENDTVDQFLKKAVIYLLFELYQVM